MVKGYYVCFHPIEMRELSEKLGVGDLSPKVYNSTKVKTEILRHFGIDVHIEKGAYDERQY